MRPESFLDTYMDMLLAAANEGNLADMEKALSVYSERHIRQTSPVYAAVVAKLLEWSRSGLRPDTRMLVEAFPEDQVAVGAIKPYASAANIVWEANELQKRHQLERVRKLKAEIADAEISDVTDPVEFLGNLNNRIGKLLAYASKSTAQSVNATVRENVAKKERVLAVPTGFDNIDERINGLPAGSFTVIAARTSVGKTILAETMAENMAKEGYSACLFSLEMSLWDMASRYVTKHTRIPLHRVLVRDLETDEIEKVQNAIAEAPWFENVYISDSIRDIRDIEREARTLRYNEAIQCVFVDYMSFGE